jgi:hypothetical protein
MNPTNPSLRKLPGVPNAGIGQQLASFNTELASGEKLNELTEK